MEIRYKELGDGRWGCELWFDDEHKYARLGKGKYEAYEALRVWLCTSSEIVSHMLQCVSGGDGVAVWTGGGDCDNFFDPNNWEDRHTPTEGQTCRFSGDMLGFPKTKDKNMHEWVDSEPLPMYKQGSVVSIGKPIDPDHPTYYTQQHRPGQ